MLADNEDSYGRSMLARYKDEESFEIVEREDGVFTCSPGPGFYFLGFEEWTRYEQEAISYAKGRCLDAGCGAGRVALYLQEQNLPVVAIDNSPLAVEVCRLRGVKDARVLPLQEIRPSVGHFDTVVMFGNNFGLFGSLEEARRLLSVLYQTTSPQALILAESNDPTLTRRPVHLAYQDWNRQRGRLPGQLRIRIRYYQYVTPWFDYLIVSKSEMEAIVAGTGWRVQRFTEAAPGEPEHSMYVAILEKER